jgi:hypothetical protein
MAKINKKTKTCGSTTCVGCLPPKKFVFKIEGSFELPAFWTADAAEVILTKALDQGLNLIVEGRCSNSIEYAAYVFEDKDADSSFR